MQDHWLIDLEPRNRGFYTGLIKLPKIHRILRGMSGLWSSAEAPHIKQSKNRHVQSKAHGVADSEYFPVESFAVIL